MKDDLLEARDGRQVSLRLALGRRAPALLTVGANLPGADKQRPGAAPLLRDALDALRAAIGLDLLESRRDRLGVFHLAASGVTPAAAKAAALEIEARGPSGRLLDLDVYGPDGAQLDRAALGLPPRPCLVCGAPARECIRLARHPQGALDRRVDDLLRPWRPEPGPASIEALAASLARGALRELELSPKPGLVDRRDCGSHPDLSHASMRVSVDLLPRYFGDILDCHREGRDLAAFVAAGVEAEARMTRAIHSNAHKGYIFLAGLVLMAACRGGGRATPAAVAGVAREIFEGASATDSHGARVRARHGLGGVRAEALAGLPAVFEHGWPRYREVLDTWAPDRAAFYLMAVLMQRVEDTTAVSRCGLEGLARLRADGAALQRLLERGQDPEPWLAARNEDYRRMGLTMGGVADCMALTFALEA